MTDRRDFSEIDRFRVSGRLKILHIDSRRVLQSVLAPHEFTEAWELDLPEGTEILSVHYDYSRCAFAFILYHDQWEVVPAGSIIPDADSISSFRVYRLSAITDAEQKATDEAFKLRSENRELQQRAKLLQERVDELERQNEDMAFEVNTGD